MRGVQESTQHELYLRSALASKINAPLKLYADIAGKFTVDRELNGKAESKVHQSTADAKKSKSGGRIRLLEAPPALNSSSNKAKSSAPPKKQRKPAVSAPIAATVKRVPVRAKNEGSSAARGQSPPPTLPTSQSTSPVPPAMRALMIHLLAKGSRTKEEVLTQVGGPDASDSLRVQLNELLVTVRTLSSYASHVPLTWRQSLRLPRGKDPIRRLRDPAKPPCISSSPYPGKKCVHMNLLASASPMRSDA
jgi:RNA polymerase II elongation factor ELL